MFVPFLFDPYRVGMVGDSRPWALPTATQFHAFSVKTNNLDWRSGGDAHGY